MYVKLLNYIYIFYGRRPQSTADTNIKPKLCVVKNEYPLSFKMRGHNAFYMALIQSNTFYCS